MSGHGAAYWLWQQEQEIERSIVRLTEDIERLEADIVKARARRDELRLVVVEMRAARGIIEKSGLKVERDGPNVTVSVDPGLLATPERTEPE